MKATAINRIFIMNRNGKEVRLADPGAEFNPIEARDFYAGNYPALTNAKILGPEIVDEEMQYRFETTIGVKG